MICKQLENGKYPLVLLHGWGLNSAVWQLLMDDLAPHFDVICIDLPGFGFNHQVVPQPYSLDAVVEQIAPLCPPNSIVLGWSLGGMVATKLAVNYPDKVAQLCLVASSPCFVEQTACAEQADWPGVKAQVLAGFSTALQDNAKRTIERFMAIQTMGSPSAKQDVKWIKQAVFSQPDADMLALVGGLAILNDEDLRAPLQQLKIPVRGIYGANDTLVPAKGVQQLGLQMADFACAIINKASHAPFISHREAFVRQFLAYNSTFI